MEHNSIAELHLPVWLTLIYPAMIPCSVIHPWAQPMDKGRAGVTDNGKPVKTTHIIYNGKKIKVARNNAGRDSISINIPLGLLCVCFWPLSLEITVCGNPIFIFKSTKILARRPQTKLGKSKQVCGSWAKQF